MAAIAKSSAQRLQRKSLRSPRRAVGQTRVAGGRCLRVKQNYLGVGTGVVPPKWCFLTPVPLPGWARACGWQAAFLWASGVLC